MILVDTSVLIDYLKGIVNAKTKLFDTVQEKQIPYGFSPYTYQEVLQGAKNEGEYGRLREYLATQTLYFLPERLSTYEEAAHMFFDLRRRGITIRSTIDMLIALTAIKNDLLLLHNDRDFDVLASEIQALRVFHGVLS